MRPLSPSCNYQQLTFSNDLLHNNRLLFTINSLPSYRLVNIPRLALRGFDCSYEWARFRSVCSDQWGPCSCSPIGNPFDDSPQGIEIPGMPARFAVQV